MCSPAFNRIDSVLTNIVVIFSFDYKDWFTLKYNFLENSIKMCCTTVEIEKNFEGRHHYVKVKVKDKHNFDLGHYYRKMLLIEV